MYNPLFPRKRGNVSHENRNRGTPGVITPPDWLLECLPVTPAYSLLKTLIHTFLSSLADWLANSLPKAIANALSKTSVDSFSDSLVVASAASLLDTQLKTYPNALPNALLKTLADYFADFFADWFVEAFAKISVKTLVHSSAQRFCQPASGHPKSIPAPRVARVRCLTPGLP